MIVYSVKININSKIEKEWLQWMKEEHIKDVLDTKYFSDWNLYKVLIPSGIENEVSYVIEYITDSIEKYEAYVKNVSKRIQEEHRKKFSGNFTAARSVMQIIE
jgi:hypothetical protein